MRKITIVLLSLFLALPAMAQVEMGDDGLHKPTWLRDTFKDLREDLAEANAEGKRLAIIIEQRGCIYCNKMHNEVFPIPVVDSFIRENFFFVQLNMFGDVEVTDFDGEVLSEREMVAKWGLLFTPTIMYFPEEIPPGQSAIVAAVSVIPGAFEKHTTLNLMRFVIQKGYDGDEPFQKFHARMLIEDGVIN